MNGSCVFCDLVADQSPHHTIFETERSIAFLDIHPIRQGHTLVVPKVHCTEFYQLNEADYVDVMNCARVLAPVLHDRYAAKKVGLLIAGFDIAHVHIHLVPMHDYHDLTSKVLLDGRSLAVTGDELDREAKALRARLSTN